MEGTEGSFGSAGEGDLLYDIIVHREWNNRTTGAPPSKNASDGSSAAITTAETALSAMNGGWRFAVADEVEDGGGGVAILHGGSIAILAKTANSNGGYVSVTKVPVPPDPTPELSRLTWSRDGRLLVHAASNGRTFIYDEGGAPIFSILSQGSSSVRTISRTIRWSLTCFFFSITNGASAASFFNNNKIVMQI